ncbi:type II toxin-antitoxin system RelB/DinJ family antitoxin [Campylobacter troglodytis]|uniref:type II toxin-antitoxin system RelB/DinJ family antitoxin n=1 Tax=Campylobacter troglodytis TaxID=654363 RepID=UPI00115899AF|nr:type II toxin-antitoxin system RelB/DinJ family antitoxin [Campylobacter troglodytis]TQR61216.1 hypothetical protein DMC01_01995 [Campylobacter troglodytis]
MSSVVQFRMDSTDKANFELILKNMGLDIGTALRMFAAKVINTGAIPFEVSSNIDPSTIMTKENLKAYKRAKKDLAEGKTISLEELKAKYGV